MFVFLPAGPVSNASLFMARTLRSEVCAVFEQCFVATKRYNIHSRGVGAGTYGS